MRADLGLDGPGATLVQRDLVTVMDSIIASGSTTPHTIRSLPAVAGAIRLISSTIAQLRLEATRGEVPAWLRNPRRYGGALDGNDILGHVIDAMTIHGAAYLRATCLTEGEQPTFRLDAVDPEYVQVLTRTDGIVGRDFLLAGDPIPEVPAMLGTCRKGQAYLVHVPFRVSVEHPEGTTPLNEAAATLYGHVTTEKHASFLMDNGTYTGGVLTTTSEITPAQAAVWQEAWIAARKTGKVAVLGNGLEYRNELADAKDLQMVEARSFNQSVVWSLLGIPLAYMGSSMMGGQSSLSYANAQDNRRAFADNCLRAYTVQIEDALSSLLPPGRNRDEEVRVFFDYSEWEGRGDAQPDDAAVGTVPA